MLRLPANGECSRPRTLISWRSWELDYVTWPLQRRYIEVIRKQAKCIQYFIYTLLQAPIYIVTSKLSTTDIELIAFSSMSTHIVRFDPSLWWSNSEYPIHCVSPRGHPFHATPPASRTNPHSRCAAWLHPHRLFHLVEETPTLPRHHHNSAIQNITAAINNKNMYPHLTPS